MIGSLRATFADLPRASSQSESTPPNITPTDAAMNGRIAKKPILSQPMWRSVAR